MSGIAKAVKKVWRPIEKIKSKVMNVATLGLWDKTKKIRHKIVKSKIFKVVVAAAAIYFGGAALMSMVGGGTASAGIGSAWAGVQGAGTALASGNIGGAFSALGNGFTAAGATQATSFATGQAAAQAAITGNTAAVGATSGAYTGKAMESFVANGGNATISGAAQAATPAVTAASNAAPSSGGLLASLGDASKSALITGAINTGGQMLAGHAQQKAAQEAQENQTYWGVDGKGNKTTLPGLLNPANLDPLSNANPVPQLQPISTLDDLIKRQQQQVKTWG